MEFEQLITLITAVSDSELTRFSYEENGTVIQMRKEKEKKLVTVNGTVQDIPALMEESAGQSEVPKAGTDKETRGAEDTLKAKAAEPCHIHVHRGQRSHKP